MGNEIFISYSRRDFDTVKAIKDQLDRELGIECWMDIDGIESGEQFEEVIVKAINTHEVFLFMLSPHSMASEYALDELAFAKRKGKRTVLLYITPCEMTDNFSFKYSKFDTIDWNNPLQHEKMMGNLRRWLNLAPKAATQTPAVSHQPSSAAPQKIPVIDRSLSANELYNLGYNYANGKNGMPVNYEAAFLYYTASAEKGNAAAMCNLGFCYERGIGTPKDLQCATYWYRKAAEGGNPTAQCNIAYCYEAGMGVAKEPQKAFYWYNQAAAQGVVRAECCVAFCYEKGIGTPVDYTKAIEWYKRAADKGHARAQCNLGYLYEYGIGVQPNQAMAIRLYTQAAEQGYPGAQFNLAYCYENGRGVEQNLQRAAELYRKSAEQGYVHAQSNLGLCYEKGKGVPQDLSLAFLWYKKAAEGGLHRAMFNLGLCYYYGRGTAVNKAEALRYMLLAQGKGNEGAVKFLKEHEF